MSFCLGWRYIFGLTIELILTNTKLSFAHGLSTLVSPEFESFTLLIEYAHVKICQKQSQNYKLIFWTFWCIADSTSMFLCSEKISNFIKICLSETGLHTFCCELSFTWSVWRPVQWEETNLLIPETFFKYHTNLWSKTMISLLHIKSTLSGNGLIDFFCNLRYRNVNDNRVCLLDCWVRCWPQ